MYASKLSTAQHPAVKETMFREESHIVRQSAHTIQDVKMYIDSYADGLRRFLDFGLAFIY